MADSSLSASELRHRYQRCENNLHSLWRIRKKMGQSWSIKNDYEAHVNTVWVSSFLGFFLHCYFAFVCCYDWWLSSLHIHFCHIIPSILLIVFIFNIYLLQITGVALPAMKIWQLLSSEPDMQFLPIAETSLHPRAKERALTPPSSSSLFCCVLLVLS